MALGKQLARTFDFAIYDGTSYQDIKGVTSFSPSREKNDADITDFDSGGWLEHIVASRSASFDIEGYHIEDDADGSRDAGQEELETLATQMGNDAMATLRLSGPGDQNEVYMTVSVDAPMNGISTGGGNDDPAGWAATLNMSGEPMTTDPEA
ncbi:MAG: phage tail tube protein [Bacillota bacterium]